MNRHMPLYNIFNNRVVIDYEPCTPSEIRLKQGDTVLLHRQANEYWFEGENLSDPKQQGVCGYVALMCVEVIEDKVNAQGAGKEPRPASLSADDTITRQEINDLLDPAVDDQVRSYSEFNHSRDS